MAKVIIYSGTDSPPTSLDINEDGCPSHAGTHENGGSDEMAIDASQVTTGQFAMARLASGTPTGSKFIRDDGTLAVPPGGGGEAFPVGAVFIAVVSTDPATLLGYGTWEAFGAGRVLVGLDSGDADFDTVEETGGAKTVTLTEAQIPAHTHTQNSHNHTQDAHTHTQNAHLHNIGQVRDATTGGATTNIAKTVDTSSTLGTATSTDNATATNQNATATNQAATAVNQNTGGGGSHTNLQPYIVVYMWKRTA